MPVAEVSLQKRDRAVEMRMVQMLARVLANSGLCEVVVAEIVVVADTVHMNLVGDQAERNRD